jgi:hypothetical protein
VVLFAKLIIGPVKDTQPSCLKQIQEHPTTSADYTHAFQQSNCQDWSSSAGKTKILSTSHHSLVLFFKKKKRQGEGESK